MKAFWIAAALLAAVSQAQAQPAADSRRVLSVSGTGEVRAVPDRGRLALGVDIQRPVLADAETEVNRIVHRYLEQLRAQGVAARHLHSTAVQIQPDYSWDEKTRRPLLTGYRVRRDLVVDVQDLARLGDWILAATAAGMNHVAPPELYSSQAAALQEQALARAATDARRKARLLAETLDSRLGPVLRLAAQEPHTAPAPMKALALRAEAAADGAADMGLQAGEIRYLATVQADFELLGPARTAR